MAGRWHWVRRHSALAVLAIAAGLVVVGGAGVAAACKLTPLYCGFSEPSPPLEPYAQAVGEISLPDGFSTVPVANGLTLPTAFDFLPDGRVLIAEKNGLVKVARDDVVAVEPVLDLRSRVNTQFFRGLVAIAVDPKFARNRFVYLVYSARRKSAPLRSASFVRVSRFELSNDLTLGRERVILGAAADPVKGCAGMPSSADCIASPGDHIGADIAFGSDGSLYVSTGDGGGEERVEERAFKAQDVDDLGGKVLRVTRDGRGLAANPFFDGDASANRAKVWALGFRNPFRLTLAPETDLPIVADVGWRDDEEINAAPAGANLGWPCFEGDEPTPQYKSTARCEEQYASAEDLRAPTLVVERSGNASVTGGVFYSGNAYPEEYRRYFFADWVQGWIRHVAIDEVSGEAEGEAEDFAENAGGPVAFRVGPDGRLYVLSLNFGAVFRIDYRS
jgi:glucose/arabinose dehydrogenase